MREAIGRRLIARGYVVDACPNLAAADDAVASFDYEVVVLDRSLPDGDGLELLRRWRQHDQRFAVLVLTARDAVPDRVEGLDAGADDYLVKPFAMAELVARVAAMVRRDGHRKSSRFEIGGLVIDTSYRKVTRDGVTLPLTPKEFAVLELLCHRGGRVVPRATLREHCWADPDARHSNVEETIIASLRRKLGPPSIIRTVRGLGYALELDARDC